MPWRSLQDVPENLKKLNGARLTLSQINSIARCADQLIAKGYPESTAWAICIATFKGSHTIVRDQNGARRVACRVQSIR